MRAATLLVIGALGVWAGCSTAVHSAGGEMDGFDRIVLPAEASGYLATSTYDDVMRVLDQVERRTAAFSEPVRQTTFGATAEERGLPLMVWGASGTSLQAIRESDKARVLVVGNIHAGEVAGKDALLELLRDVTEGEHVAWTDSLVVLIAPIYNADGNERFDLDNRRLQDGPERGMGQRPNAAGLDLNRDFMKVASPEARALVGLIRDVDPHLVVDLHTTNGTHMGYHLTYAPGLSPNTPSAIDADLRDRWLPAISETLLATDDFATYHYGNVPGAFGEEATAPRGWYTFSPQPRFATNYVGLRGRYAILSEAYSYAPFEERVAVSHRFTEEILDQAWADASRMRQRV
ncbi:MAG: M14 family metallopeptidase, partial [Bacteroidota bacterium]